MPSRLSPSRDKLTRQQAKVAAPLAANREEKRVFASLAAAVAKGGYQETTVSEIIEGAGIDRSTFYRHFSSKSDCFLAAFEAITHRIEEIAVIAGEDAESWPEEVSAGLSAVLGFLAAKPDYARLCFVEAISSTSEVVDHWESVFLERLTPFLEPERIDRSAEELAALPQTLRETIAGGLMWVIYQQVRSGRAAELQDLHAELVEFALSPYLGVNAARSVALGEHYESSPAGDSLEQLLRNADQIRARHPSKHADTTAAELVREGRER